MIEIKDLLSRFENILSNGETKKAIIREILSQTLNLDIKKEDLEIKNNIIYLNIKPIYKNEILIKKDQIVKKLEEKLGERAPKNIR